MMRYADMLGLEISHVFVVFFVKPTLSEARVVLKYQNNKIKSFSLKSPKLPILNCA